jgi:MoxR-like ATPase
LQIDVGYPERGAEREIILATTGVEEAVAEPVFDAASLIAAQTLIRRLPVGEQVVERILDLVRSARPGSAEAHPAVRDAVSWGPGPRAAQALMLAIRARALIQGRLVPGMDDVAALAHPVLIHRMALGFAARAEGQTLTGLIERLVGDTLGLEAAA